MIDLLWVRADVKRGSVVHNFAIVVRGLWFLTCTCKIPTSVMIFIAYVYKYKPTYRVTLTANPTRETKHQIGMA